jgi:hypothetical protein
MQSSADYASARFPYGTLELVQTQQGRFLGELEADPVHGVAVPPRVDLKAPTPGCQVLLLEIVNATVDGSQERVKVVPLLLLHRGRLEEEIHEQALPNPDVAVQIDPARYLRQTWDCRHHRLSFTRHAPIKTISVVDVRSLSQCDGALIFMLP